MKKRILSLILALSMVLSVLPLGAFAADPPELVMENGRPTCSNGTIGHGWTYMNNTLILMSGTYDFRYANPKTNKGGFTSQAVQCAIEIQSDATITGGIFEKKVTNNAGTIYDGIFNTMVENNVARGALGKIAGGAFNGTVTNNGTISGGAFSGTVTNRGTITAGTFYEKVENYSGGTISGGTFSTTVKNCGGTISGGTFSSTVENDSGTIKKGTFEGSVTNNSLISGGTFQNGCSVTNWHTIKDNGTFEGTVTNYGTIENGTFKGNVTNKTNGLIYGGTFQNKCSVTNYGTITGNGTFNGTVTNDYYIKNGTFKGDVTNKTNGIIYDGTFAGSVTNSGTVNSGVFRGKNNLTNVYAITWDTAYPNAKIEKVNDVSVDWPPYVCAGTTVTITANTEIFSLNGKSIGDGNCKSSYGSNNKIVKFAMPSGNVVLNGAITSTDLVMKNGLPDCLNGTKGNGWEYDSSGTLILKSGTFDFSSTHPQGKTPGTPTTTPVACAIEIQSGVTITDGTFNATVYNGQVYNGQLNSPGGTISNGTFNGTVISNGIITGNGTFEGEVINHAGTISGGTFKKKVVNNANGTISDGTFKGDVTNYSSGTISGGTFAGSVDNRSGTVTGGVFNLKANPTNVTGYAIKWDDAYSNANPNAKIVAVNGVSADWAPYVCAGTTVTITASTDIYSLNGKSIDESSYPDTTDKKTVTFTMPGEPVVLNRTAELEVVGGEIKSGETAKGSGRVLIGGKVEVTTKDKTQDFVGWTIAPEGIELRHDDGSAVNLTSE